MDIPSDQLNGRLCLSLPLAGRQVVASRDRCGNVQTSRRLYLYPSARQSETSDGRLSRSLVVRP